MKIYIQILIIMLMALAFTGCDKIRGWFIKEPIVMTGGSFDEDDMSYHRYLKIQSQDNDTIIKGLNVNRGNCAVRLYTLDEKRLESYQNKHPERLVIKNIETSYDGDDTFYFRTKLALKEGKLVEMTEGIFSDELGLYDALDSDSKALFVSEFNDEKWLFGKERIFDSSYFKCPVDTIIEVELITDTGKITLKLDEQILLEGKKGK